MKPGDVLCRMTKTLEQSPVSLPSVSMTETNSNAMWMLSNLSTILVLLHMFSPLPRGGKLPKLSVDGSSLEKNHQQKSSVPKFPWFRKAPNSVPPGTCGTFCGVRWTLRSRGRFNRQSQQESLDVFSSSSGSFFSYKWV